MTPVDQRILACPERGDGHSVDGIAGDCLRACIASLLDLPYEEVPHVVHYGDGVPVQDQGDDDPLVEEHGGLWWRRLRRWLRDSYGLDVACYAWEQPGDPSGLVEIRTLDGEPWSGHVIVGGRSPRGDFAHAVVGDYWWDEAGIPWVAPSFDPHPSRDGLRTIEDVTVIVPPYDPAPPAEDEEAGRG